LALSHLARAHCQRSCHHRFHFKRKGRICDAAEEKIGSVCWLGGRAKLIDKKVYSLTLIEKGSVC